MIPLCIFCSNQLQKRILAASSGCFSSCTTVIFILYGRNLILWLWKPPVSCARHLNDFRGLISSHSSISWTLLSASKMLFHCFFMSRTEPVARNFFTSFNTHYFMGTGESGYLWQNLWIHFLEVFSLQKFGE
jgi:hypothetical protein